MPTETATGSLNDDATTESASRDSAQAETQETLDALLKKAAELERSGEVSKREAGCIYKRLRDGDRWKELKAADGSQRYATLKAFVAAETSVSFDWFCKVIRLAENYSADEVRKHGATTLIAVLSAWASVRDDLIGALERGEIRTKRDVERMRAGLEGPARKRPKKSMSAPLNDLAKLATKLAKAPPHRRPGLAAKVHEAESRAMEFVSNESNEKALLADLAKRRGSKPAEQASIDQAAE